METRGERHRLGKSILRHSQQEPNFMGLNNSKTKVANLITAKEGWQEILEREPRSI
jgi:hypothetical protein